MDNHEEPTPASVPTYDEAFPSLPELDETRKILAEAQKSVWAASAIKPSHATQVFTIAYEELKDPEKEPLGKKQSIFKTIADETNTTISRSMSKDKSVTVTISGKLQNVQEARKKLQSSLQTQITHEVAVPKELHRFIIGKEGKILKEIEANTGTNIRVPGAADAKQTISVIGILDNVRKAAQEIQAIADEKAKLDTIRLPIRREYHSLIVASVKPITEATGVRVNVPPAAAEKDEITVSGEKPATADAARQITALYEKLRSTCGVLVTNVKKSQHKYLIGPKGATINEIFTQTGVMVEVPGQETDSEQVTLRGPTANLTTALNLVFEKANSHVSEIITIPGWLHKHVIGRGGANLKSFQEQAPKVRVEFKEGDDITLDGPPEEVVVLKTMLLTLSGELAKVLTHVDKKVDAKHHPHLIGKGGSVITQIRNDTGAEISFSDPKDKEKGSSNIVRIVGNAEAVKKASAIIDEMVAKLENQRSIDVIVPQKFHSQLIGSHGATIKSITEAFPSVSVIMPKGESEIVVVRGDKKDVDGAEKMIHKLIKQFQEEGFQMEVPVFKEFHRQIIGRSGAKIKQISEETSTRIKFPDEDSDSNMIVITGKQKNCEAAKEKILKIQGELASIVSEDVNIDSRFHAAIIGPQGRVINSIMQECGGVHIHFPHGADKAAKPNVVTIRGPKDDVKKAKAKLEDLASNELLNHHTEEVKIKREFLRFLVGRGGAERAKVQDATGARLFFPRASEGLAPSADDDIITIVGKKEACEAAKKQLLNRVKQLENTTEATVTIEPTFYKDLVANRGRFLKDLAEEFGGVVVTIPRPDSEGKYASDVITLKGSKEDVPKAIARIQKFVEDVKNRVSLECKVPGSAIPAVMGPGGSNVNKICTEFSVVIKLPERKRAGDKEAKETKEEAKPEGEEGAESSEEKLETVTVSGVKDACEQAIAALLALVPVKEVIEIDSKHFPAIIGEKGSRIAQLSQETNTRINLPKKGNTVTIKGTPGNVAAAKERLAAIVTDLDLKSFSVDVEVDAKHHPTLIGNKGSAITEFRSQYNVNISFPRSKAGEEQSNLITLTGFEKDVEVARAALLEKVKELESMVTLELSIDPRVHPRIIGARGSAVKALQDKHKVRIIFPREKNSWQILVVGPEESAEEAKNALELSADDFMQDILDQEHLQQFVKPTTHNREAEERVSHNTPFQVRNAPWDASGQNFPVLGGAAARAAAPVWGAKRS